MTPLEDDLEMTESAAQAFSESVEAQFVASLLEYLRANPRPWWRPADLHAWWPTEERFRWYVRRPDLRAQVTHQLTGFASGAARASADDLQAELVERVLEAGDIDVETWDAAFDAQALAVHGPRATIWGTLRAQFPWDDASVEDRAFLVWLIERLLVEDRGVPILTALYVRSAIDVRVWQEHIPLELRAQVDARRLRRELEGAPFTCEDELSIVGVSKVVQHVPLVHLQGVLDALERVLEGLAGTDADLDDEALPNLGQDGYLHLDAVDDEEDDQTELRKAEPAS